MSPRRIPTKGELLRLQRLYRTDKRIADVLGNGVTEHLVAYWRRKKGIAVYSFPKFSEKEIREIWDRFGDDFHAGMELGISKAAFYNWRRRYKITKKPEALKLEQLSLELNVPDRRRQRQSGTGRQTIVQKLLSQRTEKESVIPGESVEVEPDMVVVPDDADLVLTHFQQAGVTYVWNPNRIIIPLDAALSGNGPGATRAHKELRDFARRQQIRNLFDFGEGCPQQLVIEKGLVLPGHFCLASGSRSTSLGCLGAVMLAVDAESMSRVWATGKIQINVPETIRINITGRPPRGVFVRDVMQQIAAHLGASKVEGKVLEFYGAGVEQMSLSERITLCHLSAVPGARAAICPYDGTTRRYVNPRARRPFAPITADRDAEYTSEYSFDMNTMKPNAMISGRMESVVPVEELDGISIRQVFVGGITSGRFDDLKVVADIFKGKRVHPDVRCIIQPASRAIYLEALKKGLIRVFVEAGSIILNPGSLLMGARLPLLSADEKGLTTHFDPSFMVGEGALYQVSPATAAASALTGQITNPAGYVKV